MRFSTKARYGLRLVIRIATECASTGTSHRPIPLWRLAKKEHMSKKYVEHIVSQLERAGILKGFRGPTGGYCLARHPRKITVREVIEATEGIRPNVCTQSLTDCPFYPYSMECKARPFWVELENVIRNYLESVTIQSLSRGTESKRMPKRRSGK